jgi:hypothetical protein
MGLYHEQLRRYYNAFGRDRIRVYLYEDFQADPAGVLRDLFRFIGVDDRFTPDVSVRHNECGLPPDRRPPLRPGVEGELRDAFERDVMQLEGLIGRDLSSWLGRLRRHDGWGPAAPADVSRHEPCGMPA